MASSSLSTRGWTYDVFLSFRGEDTRDNFTDHLYAALIKGGIRVYKDNIDLLKGEAISPQLLKSIEESRFAVVVFSRNYGNSCWCLDELAKIMECRDQKGQKVLPVFYHVDPSDVRKQKGELATAFEQHEEKLRGETEKVNKWRSALAASANLSGWHIPPNSGGEYAFVEKIVHKIWGDIRSRGLENNLVGIESRIDELISLVGMEATKEVRIIGILGMGGIGKTTIAQALFRRVSNVFEGSSFVKNIRENSSYEKDTCALQEKILKDILRTQIEVQDREDGADEIQTRLCTKKVLLVLDDVDDFEQLEFLAARHEWFGPGSRIIITTRDEHMLSRADAEYKPALLLMEEAVELFSMHAFQEKSPIKGYEKLSDRAIHYTGFLPLAVKVLGSFFQRREAGVWEDALKRLAETPNRKIFDTLKLSFDGLEDSEKKIFLDIACFFIGEKVKDVIKTLDCCGFNPKIGIDVLIKKSLITVSRKSLEMHALLQEMGLQIVHKSFPNSRLWKHEEIHDLFKKNRTLETVEAVVMCYNNEGLNADVFESMNNLRLLEVERKFTSSEPTVLPDSLRWLRWFSYPFSSLPLSDKPKLVSLKMEHSKIKHLWKGQKIMRNLKFIHLDGSESLTTFPDVSGAPNVERLTLSECENLVEVHESLGYLKRLVYLDMRNCYYLKCLPSMIEMESLETLILAECIRLERFPEVSPCMVKLSHLDLSSCCELEELPSSIGYLSNLSFLNLTSCDKMKKLPEEFGSMKNLQELLLGSSRWHKEPINLHALTKLCSLRKLDLGGRQIGEEDFPKNLHELSSLEELDLSRNDKMIQLPAGISHLSHLKYLDLSWCYNLQILHGLPSGIQVLVASNCTSLEKIEDLSKDHECLYKISLINCHKLLVDEENETYFDNMLQESIFKKCAAIDQSLSIRVPGSKIPSWFKEQKHGAQIVLKLPPKLEAEIMGFAICGLFSNETNLCQSVSFRLEDGGMLVPELNDFQHADRINASAVHANENVCISYLPFTLFQQKRNDDEDDDDDDNDYAQCEYSLVIKVSSFGKKAIRCGAHAVYKEDVESIQHIKPSLSSYCKWTLSNHPPDTICFSENL